MVPPCKAPRTNTDKVWPYDEYYIGEKDKDHRKEGIGSNHWTGAESIECYTGRLLRETMHGEGQYSYRHRVAENMDFTYEGYFYNNFMHGYGVTSYSNGRVYSGIYYNNLRWGPGVESHACLREDVGMWKGTQLVRLTWKPATPSVVPDLLSTSVGRRIVAQNRIVLVSKTKAIGEINPALELLKQCGAKPLIATHNWPKLYPKNCTDKDSMLYQKDVFERAYYNNHIETLEKLSPKVMRRKNKSDKLNEDASQESMSPPPMLYYSWNNNEMMIFMMKHCYQHEKQRGRPGLRLPEILNGPREVFKPAGQHELDSRTILMACYLGHIKNVAQLINEYDVNPKVTDMQGNSTIMYATCGYQPHIVHFLVEAGARINNYNDACCTPLGVALINYACARLDLEPCKILQAILPPVTGPPQAEPEDLISDWLIERDLSNPAPPVTKKDDTASNKTVKSTGGTLAKKVRSVMSVNNMKTMARTDSQNQTDPQQMFSEEKRVYINLINEYTIRVNELFRPPDTVTPIPYLFEVADMVSEIDTASEEQKKATEKKDTKKLVSRSIKDIVKNSREMMTSSIEQNLSIDIKEQIKMEHMEQMMLTIKQLLMDGADPCLVNTPQPALFIAITSHSAELVRLLIKYGADVNEVYPQALGYTPLDIAVAGPLTNDNLKVIRALLECGAHANHRLPVVNATVDHSDAALPGPTLLHAALSKRADDDESSEDIRNEIIELLLNYECDPVILYKGYSAMDLVMSKYLGVIFDIFIESPNTNLNAIINESNQTILVRMFNMPYAKTIPVADRLQMLTNLLLFGADPLLQCQNEEEVYDNLFVYAQKALLDADKPVASAGKQDAKKAKTDVKAKKSEKLKTLEDQPKGTPKPNVSEEVTDYLQCLSLVSDCARLLFIRWLQAKLLKELILIVDKFKHRHWNMILKEYKNGKTLGIWLNPVRCLEIWDVYKTTKKRIYEDNKILKHVLCIVHYYFRKAKKILREPTLSSQEKSTIESEIAYFLREHKKTMVTNAMKRPYVMPELTPYNEISKFNVCFECSLPLLDEKITCCKCKLVDFCTMDCMRLNVDRDNCHPCSDNLRAKYFPTPENSETDEIVLEVPHAT